MERLKVAIIGIGHDHAMGAIDSLQYMPDVFEIVGFALAEGEQEKFSKSAEKCIENGLMQLSLDEVLSYLELDGVVIETEEKNLVKYATMAAERGLNIHMDKPGGVSLDEFENLIRIAKSKKLAFSMGYMYRFNPTLMKVIKKIENGELGEIYSIEAHMNCLHPRKKRQWLEGFPGGMMFYLGCHLVDIVYRIQGKPEEVIPYNTSIGYEGVTAMELGMAVFKYKHGVSFVKACDLEQGGFMRRQIVICGTKGTVEIRPTEAYDWDNKVGSKMHYTCVRELYNKSDFLDDADFKRSELFSRYDDMMKNYAEMIRGTVMPQYDYELELYKLVLRACGASN